MGKFNVTMPYQGTVIFADVEANDEEDAVEKCKKIAVPQLTDWRDNVDLKSLGEDASVDNDELFTFESDDAEVEALDEEEEEEKDD